MNAGFRQVDISEYNKILHYLPHNFGSQNIEPHIIKSNAFNVRWGGFNPLLKIQIMSRTEMLL